MNSIRSVYIIIFIYCFLPSEAQRLVISNALISQLDTASPAGLDIIPYAEVYIDSSRRLNHEELKNKTFSLPDTDLYLPYDWHFHYCYRIKINNSDSLQTLKAGFKLSRNAYWFELNQTSPFQKWINGSGIPYNKRDFKDEPYYLPFEIAASDSAEYYIVIKSDHNAHQHFLRIESEKQRVLNIKEHLANNSGPVFVLSFYLLIWTLMILFCISQYFVFHRKSFLWYSIYLLGNTLFFLRNMEMYFYKKILIFYIGLAPHAEPFLTYLSIAMYMVFIKGFVQSVSGQNKHYKQFTLAARIFFSILMADVIILLFMGPVTSIEVFHFIRPVFMIFYAYALYVLITYFDRVEIKLVFAGSLILFIGILYTATEQFFIIQKTVLWSGILREYQIGSRHLYFFQMPTCITIELLCLTLALYVTTYKEHQKFKSLLIENDVTKVRLSKLDAEKLNLEGIRSMLETEIAYIKASSDIDQSLIAEYQDKVSGLNATLLKLHNLNIQKKQEESIKTSEFFERGRKIVHANLGDQSFKTESWAEAMFLSRSQFSNRWTQETGLAPSRYLLQCRVLKGKELLAAKSEKTIAAIAYECGFSDHAHFTRKFIEYFQLSPSEYRQSHSQSV